MNRLWTDKIEYDFTDHFNVEIFRIFIYIKTFWPDNNLDLHSNGHLMSLFIKTCTYMDGDIVKKQILHEIYYDIEHWRSHNATFNFLTF